MSEPAAHNHQSTEAPKAAGRRVRLDRVALAIFVLALAARLLHVWFLRESPLSTHLLIDSVSYDARALDFLNGRWLPREGAFYQAPLYPLFLAGIYRVFGHSLLAVRVAQSLLGSGTAVLVYLIGRRCAGRTVGAVAGSIVALYAMMIHFDFEILRSSLVLFLGTLSLHLLLVAAERRTLLRWATAGLVLGLGAVARPTLLAFAPVAGLWALLRRSGPRRPAVLAATVLVAASLVAPGIVTGMNYAGTGQFVPISMNGGLNFYLGNNPDYDATVRLRPGTRWTLLNREPGVDPTKDPAGWSRYYYRKALAWVGAEPAEYAGLLAKKIVLFWNGHEIERNSSFDHVSEESPILAFPLVSFRWVAPLALVGLLLALRRRAKMGLLALFLGTQMLAIVAFYICARHRLPVVPALALFAAYGAVSLARELRCSPRGAIPYLLLCGVVAVGVNIDAYGASQRDHARPNYELALIARREHRLDDALELLEASRARLPEDPDPHFETGNTLLLLDRDEEAVDHFARAAELEPRYAPTWYNLGLSRARAGDSSGAEQALLRALALQPRYPEAAALLGTLLEEQQRLEEAAQAYGAAVGMARGGNALDAYRESLARVQQLIEDPGR